MNNSRKSRKASTSSPSPTTISTFSPSHFFSLQNAKNTPYNVSENCVLGTTETPTFCVRFDPMDKYIAAGKYDGSIQIFNALTKKPTYTLNTGMDEPRPMQLLKWRPLNGPGITKNVLLSVCSNGALQHWHTTSGRLLHTIHDDMNKLEGADFKNDGT